MKFIFSLLTSAFCLLPSLAGEPIGMIYDSATLKLWQTNATELWAANEVVTTPVLSNKLDQATNSLAPSFGATLTNVTIWGVFQPAGPEDPVLCPFLVLNTNGLRIGISGLYDFIELTNGASALKFSGTRPIYNGSPLLVSGLAGDGSALTNLVALDLRSTLGTWFHSTTNGAEIMAGDGLLIVSNAGPVSSLGGFAGSAAGLSNVPASALTGTLPLGVLPAAVLTNGQAITGVGVSGSLTATTNGTTVTLSYTDSDTNYLTTLNGAQPTNANLTTLAGGDGSGLTNGIGATNNNQFVTLSQLNNAQSVYRTFYFWSGSNSVVNTNAKAMRTLDYGVAPLGTNTVTVSSNAQYIVYCSPAAGLTTLKQGTYTVNATMWQSAVAADAVSVSAEIYVRQTNGTEIEITPVSAPAAQAISGNALEYVFSLAVGSNVTINATDSIELKFKTSAVAGAPVTLYISAGQFGVPTPSSQYVLSAQPTATGVFTGNGGGLTNVPLGRVAVVYPIYNTTFASGGTFRWPENPVTHGTERYTQRLIFEPGNISNATLHVSFSSPPGSGTNVAFYMRLNGTVVSATPVFSFTGNGSTDTWNLTSGTWAYAWPGGTNCISLAQSNNAASATPTANGQIVLNIY